MAPVVHALHDHPELTPFVLSTGQHKEQLLDVLKVFDLQVDEDLALMTAEQTLSGLAARILPRVTEVLQRVQPRYVLVHGDTLTTFVVALAAFFEGIPVAHVEAGLRSHRMDEPFPEEANRRLTDVLTALDLPPTEGGRENLLNEGKDADRTVVTGNTAVDAALYVAAKSPLPPDLPEGPYVTITMHRRENIPHMEEMAQALARVAKQHPQYTFVYPVHLNPKVRRIVWPVLDEVENVCLVDPYRYDYMIALLKASTLVVTDSGGIQEEGAALNVPVVVLRNVTERPEGVEAGKIVLAGNDGAQIERVVNGLLADPDRLDQMRGGESPYGDGQAAERVVQAVAWALGLDEKPADWVYQPDGAEALPYEEAYDAAVTL